MSVAEDTESLQIQAIMYNIEPSDVNKNNMSITVVMGCYRIVFLNMFVTSIMVIRDLKNYYSNLK